MSKQGLHGLAEPQGPPLYPQYMPHYDSSEKIEPIGPFEFNDPALRADKAMPNLLRHVEKRIDLSPHVGIELHGLQVSQLNEAGLDELALLCAQRGAIVLRNQDFADIGFEAQKKIASHFGKLHLHPWMAHPKEEGQAEFTIVYDDASDLRIRRSWAQKSPIQFHVDQSAEPQPPGVTFFQMLEQPDNSGGDTIIASTSRAFERLSPTFRKRLEGLWAVHTTANPILREIRDNGGSAVVRREITKSVHPVVCVHPVTKRKYLFVNSSYTQSIVGMDDEESEYLLKFLFDHINRGQDFACRVRYEPGTLVIWDQRETIHSQTLDYPAGRRRHAFRLTPLANVPVPALIEEDDEEWRNDPIRFQAMMAKAGMVDGVVAPQ